MIAMLTCLWAMTIELQPKVELTRDTIYLRDLASADSRYALREAGLDLISLGKAPNPGQARSINRSFIEGVLSRDGVTIDWKGSQACQVQRKSQIAPHDLLRDEIQSWLERHSHAHGRFELETMKVALPTNLPTGNLEFQIFSASRALKPGRNLMMVDCLVNGVKRQGLSVNMLLTMEVKAGRVLRTIQRGESIRPDDVIWETIKLDRVTAPLISPEQLQAAQARITIPAGTVLDLRKVEKIPLVERNQLVYVSAQNGTLHVRMQAKSLDRGGIGETVRLKNLDSGKMFQATVSGLGEAQLKL